MEVFLGDIQLFPYSFVPRDWAECNGQLLPVMQNQALFALIGPRFGGDGRTTFGLPNLQGAEPVQGTRYCIALEGIFPSRS